MHSDFSEPGRFSRRHLLKAIAISAGAVSVALPQAANAQSESDWGGGWGHGGGGNCFLRGTQIRCSNGYRPIETLAIGDSVPARFSGAAPIHDILSFSVCRNSDGSWPLDCRPVRIHAGALGENNPTRDLVVTNSHAMFLDGVLIPIGDLVNGKTILFDDGIGLDTLEYFHIDFGAHDVVDAEGALCETFREETAAPCAPILSFSGGRGRLTSHLRSAIAPLVDRRLPLDRIRDGLEARAGL